MPYVLEVVVTAEQIHRAVEVGGGSMAHMVRHAEALHIDRRGSMISGEGGLNVKQERSPHGESVTETFLSDYFDIATLSAENAFSSLVKYVYVHRTNAHEYIGALRCLKMLLICNVSLHDTIIEDGIALGIFSGCFVCGPFFTARSSRSAVEHREVPPSRTSPGELRRDCFGERGGGIALPSVREYADGRLARH